MALQCAIKVAGNTPTLHHNVAHKEVSSFFSSDTLSGRVSNLENHPLYSNTPLHQTRGAADVSHPPIMGHGDYPELLPLSIAWRRHGGAVVSFRVYPLSKLCSHGNINFERVIGLDHLIHTHYYLVVMDEHLVRES